MIACVSMHHIEESQTAASTADKAARAAITHTDGGQKQEKAGRKHKKENEMEKDEGKETRRVRLNTAGTHGNQQAAMLTFSFSLLTVMLLLIERGNE